MDPEPNELLQPIAFLLGTWRGRGEGIYPTIDSFSYEEEAAFTHTGRPFLIYSSKTWHPDTRRPMHAENGFIRALEGGRVEVVIAHAFGITEISEGSAAGTSIEVESIKLTSSSTAKTVDAVTRSIRVDDGELTYTIGMAFGGHALQNHLEASLQKVS